MLWSDSLSLVSSHPMSSTLSFIHKLTGAHPGARLKKAASDLAHDLWYDGPENPFIQLLNRASFKKLNTKNDTARDFSVPKSSASQWQAVPGEVAEVMWGQGWIMPGEPAISEKLIKPIPLKKQMSVLDLSAGLGGRAQQLVDEFGVVVTGLETDANIAVRGMTLLMEAHNGRKASITSYDPSTFKLNKGYDAIMARELLYKIEDKEKFLQSLIKCANPNAYVSFTDYIVDPDQLAASGIKAWTAYENQAHPIGLIEMGEVWAKSGFYLINQEDLTSVYKKEILLGLKRMVTFLSTSKNPNAVTRRALRRDLQLWMHRLGAIEAGMRLFRFLGTKHT